MITAKVFEIRDAATFLPVVAVLMTPSDLYQAVGDKNQGFDVKSRPQEMYLLRRCGYAHRNITVALFRARASGEACWSDAEAWDDRTMSTAHKYIEENWFTLEDGQVIDVEFILGETKQPKVSEAHE